MRARGRRPPTPEFAYAKTFTHATPRRGREERLAVVISRDIRGSGPARRLRMKLQLQSAKVGWAFNESECLVHKINTDPISGHFR